jgi:hypothetical protein
VRNIHPAVTVHIAQFATLLRDRQMVTAFDKQALFGCLRPGLSRAFSWTCWKLSAEGLLQAAAVEVAMFDI